MEGPESRMPALESIATDKSLRMSVVLAGETHAEGLKRFGLVPDAGAAYHTPLNELLQLATNKAKSIEC